MGVLQKIREKDRVVELNTSGFHYTVKEAFPSPELEGRSVQLYIPVVTGSDAHTPETAGRDFDRARGMLSAAWYLQFTGFSHRQSKAVLF